jgi:hypothetical protein
MRIIGTRIHGLLDYCMGLLLIGAPLLLNLSTNEAETWVLIGAGIIIIIYSLLTNYELGAVKRVPVRTHLRLDLAVGILLCVSPWLFGFSEFVWQPHFFLGIIIICLSIVTKPRASAQFRRNQKSATPVIPSVIEP